MAACVLMLSHAFESCCRNAAQVSRHFLMASVCAFIARWCGVSMPKAELTASAASAAMPLVGAGALGTGGSLARSGKALDALTAP